MTLTARQEELLRHRMLCVCGCAWRVHSTTAAHGPQTCFGRASDGGCGCTEYVDAKCAEDVKRIPLKR